MQLTPLWQEVEARFACAHEQQVACVKTASNGARHYGWQCARCGDWQAARKEERSQFSARLSEFDAGLRDEWFRARQEYSKHLSTVRRMEDKRQWFEEHSRYLESSDWERRRAAVLKRDEGLCKARLRGCRTVANQAHHLTYDHWQNEPLFDLIAVCSSCHERITEMDRARRA